MTIYYVDPLNGANTNGGSSTGSAIASGTFGSTNGTSTVDLSGDTPNLSGVSVGDTIRLSAETGGKGGGASDIFEITAVDDGLDTVTVTPTPGTNSGQTWAIGGAWATLQKAADTAIAGDEVRLMNTATETPAATVDFDINNATQISPVRFIGSDASGVPLTTGFYTVSGSSLPASSDLIYGTVSHRYFTRVRFTAAKRHGLSFANFVGDITLNHCRVDNNASNGIQVQGPMLHLIHTEVDNNVIGVASATATRGQVTALFCKIHDNSSGGFSIGRSDAHINTYICNLIYRNGNDGIYEPTPWNTFIQGNTIFDNGGNGVNLNTTSNGRVIFLNNSISSNGLYGLNVSSGGVERFSLIGFNHTHGNESGSTNINGNVMPGEGNVTGDPLFASTTIGSEDFTPGVGSPLLNAGLGAA